jgi:predicted transglutaminase-like cysteine proteinase
MVSKAWLAGAGLFVSGCATFGQGPGALDGERLQAVREAPAPRGAASFCKRSPSACADGAPDEAPDPRELFRALLASHQREAASIAPPPQMQIQPQAPPLTKDGWRLLAAVNRAVNEALQPATDEEVYGLSDYWTTPLEESGAARGDCEDYALEKRALLIAHGWPAGALSIAIAMGKAGAHATLIAHTDRGDLVLDNGEDRPAPLRRAPYQWLVMQTGHDFRAWRTVRVVSVNESSARA